MIAFIIKSAICLTVLYGFYHLFLLNTKAFEFNRFYLMFSLLFALVIPLISIRVGLNLPVNSNINGFSNLPDNFIQGEKIITDPVHFLTFSVTLIIIYFIVSAILLVRFALNIYKIIKLILTSSIVTNFKTKIALVEDKTLPYSFFRYIFVNRSDYENGKIEKELLIHEQTHCLQYHSIDILIIELVKIILWFNPLLWLFRKAIQLNHEFLADYKVLSNHDLNEYQNTLLNFVFRNNSTYLASNFNYSLTKKRLIMMTKNNSLSNAIFRKVAAIPLFMILAISLTFAQEEKEIKSDLKVDNEWWYPFLKKHGFNIDKNNFKILYIADKINGNSYQNIKVAFNEGDTAIYIVEAPKSIVNKEEMSFEFSNGKDYRYYKDGDFETGGFKKLKLQK
jgi:bla regulator protein blaR1